MFDLEQRTLHRCLQYAEARHVPPGALRGIALASVPLHYTVLQGCARCVQRNASGEAPGSIFWLPRAYPQQHLQRQAVETRRGVVVTEASSRELVLRTR